MSIYESLIAAKKDIGAIGKDSVNKQQGFKFRGIDDVYNYLHSILAKHEIITVPEVLDAQRQERVTKNGTALLYSILTMKYTFYAKDGSSICAVVVGEGMDSGDKATNKAMAIAHKYALLQVFMIPTQEQQDPDFETHEVAPVKQTKQEFIAQARQDAAPRIQASDEQWDIMKALAKGNQTRKKHLADNVNMDYRLAELTISRWEEHDNTEKEQAA